MHVRGLFFCFGVAPGEDKQVGKSTPRNGAGPVPSSSANLCGRLSRTTGHDTALSQSVLSSRSNGKSGPICGSPSGSAKQGATAAFPATPGAEDLPLSRGEPASQRDAMICERMSAAVTVFNMLGQVIHQNSASIFYMGNRLESEPQGENVLAQVFQLEPEKLVRMLQDTERQAGGRWRGIVRVPFTLGTSSEQLPLPLPPCFSGGSAPLAALGAVSASHGTGALASLVCKLDPPAACVRTVVVDMASSSPRKLQDSAALCTTTGSTGDENSVAAGGAGGWAGTSGNAASSVGPPPPSGGGGARAASSQPFPQLPSALSLGPPSATDGVERDSALKRALTSPTSTAVPKAPIVLQAVASDLAHAGPEVRGSTPLQVASSSLAQAILDTNMLSSQEVFGQSSQAQVSGCGAQSLSNSAPRPRAAAATATASGSSQTFSSRELVARRLGAGGAVQHGSSASDSSHQNSLCAVNGSTTTTRTFAHTTHTWTRLMEPPAGVRAGGDCTDGKAGRTSCQQCPAVVELGDPKEVNPAADGITTTAAAGQHTGESLVWDAGTNPLATSTFGLALSRPTESVATGTAAAAVPSMVSQDLGNENTSGGTAAAAAASTTVADCGVVSSAGMAIDASCNGGDSRPDSTAHPTVRVVHMSPDIRLRSHTQQRNLSLGHLTTPRASSFLAPRGHCGGGGGHSTAGGGFSSVRPPSRASSSIASLPGSPHSRALVFASSLRNAPTSTQMLVEGSRGASLQMTRVQSRHSLTLLESPAAVAVATAIAAAAPPHLRPPSSPFQTSAALLPGPEAKLHYRRVRGGGGSTNATNNMKVAKDFLGTRRSVDAMTALRQASLSRTAGSSLYKYLGVAPSPAENDCREAAAGCGVAATSSGQHSAGHGSVTACLSGIPSTRSSSQAVLPAGRSFRALNRRCAAPMEGPRPSGLEAATEEMLYEEETATPCEDAEGVSDLEEAAAAASAVAAAVVEEGGCFTAEIEDLASCPVGHGPVEVRTGASGTLRSKPLDATSEAPEQASMPSHGSAKSKVASWARSLFVRATSFTRPERHTASPAAAVDEISLYGMIEGSDVQGQKQPQARRASPGGQQSCSNGCPEDGEAGRSQAQAQFGACGEASGPTGPRVECWHEVWATRAVDPVTGEDVLVLSQHDVTAKVIAERHLALVMEAEHRLLEQLFPKHILQHVTEEWMAAAESGATGRGMTTDSLAAGQPAMHPAAADAGRVAAAPAYSAAKDASRGAAFDGGPQWRPVVRDCNALATWHPEVTLLFADIKGFTPMCKQVTPREVMTMLNDLFSRFDAMLDKFGVFKVETIGDCYFVAGGLMHEDEDGMAAVRDCDTRKDTLHAQKVFMFAKAMLSAAREVRMPSTGDPVQIRIGISSGPVVSGVVGTRMPRFCLFGDTVNTTSRMESTGQPGAIHASESAFALLRSEVWEPTGGIEVKGKGLMQTYLWRPILEARGTSARQIPVSSASAAAAAVAALRLRIGAAGQTADRHGIGIGSAGASSSSGGVDTAAALAYAAVAAATSTTAGTGPAISAATFAAALQTTVKALSGASTLTGMATGTVVPTSGCPAAGTDDMGDDGPDPLLSMLLNHAD